MLKRSPLDDLLRALADATRRQIVERLGNSPASSSEIAKPFEMSLAAVVQHLQLLEEAGIVASEKVGRVRTYRLEPGGMDTLALWIEARRHPSERRLDRLAKFFDQPTSEQDKP
ncbi:ArsR/SmtB family transcription factor [Roseococcus sp. YIM B11640]|uniref:ArsR/SmtB family transcription factor n=1 Tax=Roseococcus sp. YIM B11640 TaxID=3133973 RepID=UPI003C7C54F3